MPTSTHILSEEVDPKPPLVSVIMPAFNAGDVLARAVHSVQAQSLGDWELILVDDGSTDSTLAVAQGAAAHDPRLKVIALVRNGGAAAARNAAIRASRGRYIAFLDADDEWLSAKLERQIGWMQERDMAFGYTAYVRGTPEAVVTVPASVNHAQLLRGNVIGSLTVIYDTAVFGRVEMPLFRRCEDFALWLQLLRKTPLAHGLNEPLSRYHRDPERTTLSSSLSRNIVAMLRVYRHQEGLWLPKALFCLASHLLGSQTRRASAALAKMDVQEK
jgi:teichuronic acid biosynthesis glycosyltransferase TuaG